MSDDARSSPSGDFQHEPVMVDRVVELFDPVPPGYYVDATLGGGGHALRVGLRHDGTSEFSRLHVVGFDQDDVAIAAANKRLAVLGDRFTAIHRNFSGLAEEVAARGFDPVTAILIDLGVSSPQLDDLGRGFSYNTPDPLDMRMDRRQELTADVVVNSYEPARLRRIISTNADERFAHRIAGRICDNRPIRDTEHLAEVVKEAIPAAKRRTGGHPAKRTFQAIRMEVNSELEVLTDVLTQAIDVLGPGGRCAVLSYHSGEDRIVKHAFRDAVTGGCECPPVLGCVCGAVPLVSLVTRGAERPSDEEVARNRRAKPARLRCVERLRPQVATSGVDDEVVS